MEAVALKLIDKIFSGDWTSIVIIMLLVILLAVTISYFKYIKPLWFQYIPNLKTITILNTKVEDIHGDKIPSIDVKLTAAVSILNEDKSYLEKILYMMDNQDKKFSEYFQNQSEQIKDSVHDTQSRLENIQRDLQKVIYDIQTKGTATDNSIVKIDNILIELSKLTAVISQIHIGRGLK